MYSEKDRATKGICKKSLELKRKDSWCGKFKVSDTKLVINDVLHSLMNLGYTKEVATNVVEEIISKNIENKTVENLIRESLKVLSR